MASITEVPEKSPPSGEDPATSGARYTGSNFPCPDDCRKKCLACAHVALAYSALALDSGCPWRTRAVADGNGSLLRAGSRRNPLNRLLTTGVTMIKRLRASSSKRNLGARARHHPRAGDRPDYRSAANRVIRNTTAEGTRSGWLRFRKHPARALARRPAGAVRNVFMAVGTPVCVVSYGRNRSRSGLPVTPHRPPFLREGGHALNGVLAGHQLVKRAGRTRDGVDHVGDAPGLLHHPQRDPHRGR